MSAAIDLAAAVCRRFEGLRLRPYICPAGVPTIGYGATRYENGLAVSLADSPISAERAEELLRWELERNCLPAVRRLCPGVTGDGRIASLLDFTFNLGAGRLQSSTLRKRVNAGDWVGASEQFGRWVFGGGKVLPGLVKRNEVRTALMLFGGR